MSINWTVEAIAGLDTSIGQRLVRDGVSLGLQFTLKDAWSGYYIDLGASIDPAALDLTAGKVIQVAFGGMEGLAVRMVAVIANRFLQVDQALGNVVQAGSTIWIMDVPVPLGDIPALLPSLLDLLNIAAAPFQLSLQLGVSKVSGYLKGDLGMSRLIRRSSVYSGPGDLSELPTPMKTRDKIPTAHGWQWPRTSKLFFDETEGVEYILLEDTDGNYDRITTPAGARSIFQKKRVVITVPTDGIEITIMSPNVNIIAYNNMNVKVGGNLTANVKKDANITVSKNASLKASGILKVHAEGAVKISAAGLVAIDGALVTINSGGASNSGTGTILSPISLNISDLSISSLATTMVSSLVTLPVGADLSSLISSLLSGSALASFGISSLDVIGNIQQAAMGVVEANIGSALSLVPDGISEAVSTAINSVAAIGDLASSALGFITDQVQSVLSLPQTMADAVMTAKIALPDLKFPSVDSVLGTVRESILSAVPVLSIRDAIIDNVRDLVTL